MCSFGGLRYRSGSRQVLALGLPTPQGRAQIVAPAGTGVGLAGRRRGLVEVGQLRADLIDVRAHRGLARVYARAISAVLRPIPSSSRAIFSAVFIGLLSCLSATKRRALVVKNW
jgi:hypothetical protein